MIFLYALFIFCALPIPQRLIRPGTVIVGKTTCKYTKKLVEWMKTEGRPFTIEYIDNDKELNNYIVDEHKGGIPIVFENGVYQGTGKEYVNKQYGGVSQPVPQPIEPVKPQPVPQPIEPVTIQPVPQPIEPVTIQPAAPQQIAPQPITSQTSTPNPIAPPPSPQQPVAPKTTLPCVINPVTNPVICKN